MQFPYNRHRHCNAGSTLHALYFHSMPYNNVIQKSRFLWQCLWFTVILHWSDVNQLWTTESCQFLRSTPNIYRVNMEIEIEKSHPQIQYCLCWDSTMTNSYIQPFHIRLNSLNIKGWKKHFNQKYILKTRRGSPRCSRPFPC